MEEKKLTDEVVNATVKSLKWVCNQIPNDLGNSNEEKMLKCIQLYCQQGIAVIERLQKENEELKSPKFASWKLKFFKAQEEIERLTKENAELKDKIEKGTLIELNDKLIGESVYGIQKDTAGKYWFDSDEHTLLGFTSNGIVTWNDAHGYNDWFENGFWFLTRKKAEAKFEELQNGK